MLPKSPNLTRNSESTLTHEYYAFWELFPLAEHKKGPSQVPAIGEVLTTAGVRGRGNFAF